MDSPFMNHSLAIMCNLVFFKRDHFVILNFRSFVIYILNALAQVFSYEFCEIFTRTFFTGNLWKIASEEDHNSPPMAENMYVCCMLKYFSVKLITRH